VALRREGGSSVKNCTGKGRGKKEKGGGKGTEAFQIELISLHNNSALSIWTAPVLQGVREKKKKKKRRGGGNLDRNATQFILGQIHVRKTRKGRLLASSNEKRAVQCAASVGEEEKKKKRALTVEKFSLPRILEKREKEGGRRSVLRLNFSSDNRRSPWQGGEKKKKKEKKGTTMRL